MAANIGGLALKGEYTHQKRSGKVCAKVMHFILVGRQKMIPMCLKLKTAMQSLSMSESNEHLPMEYKTCPACVTQINIWLQWKTFPSQLLSLML